MRIVREHYLRDDLTCGSSTCSDCAPPNTCLEAAPSSVSELCTDPHYIIPDTNVFIHQVFCFLLKSCLFVFYIQCTQFGCGYLGKK